MPKLASFRSRRNSCEAGELAASPRVYFTEVTSARTPRQTGSSGLPPRPSRPAPQGSPEKALSSPRDPESFVVEVRRIVRSGSTDFCMVLGLAPGTTDMQTIQARYRQLMRMLHPDKRTEDEEAMVGGKNVCDEAVAMVQRAVQAARQDKDGGEDRDAPTGETAVRKPSAEEPLDTFVGMSPRRGMSPRGMSPRGSPGSEEERLRTPVYTPRGARTRRAETPRRAPMMSGLSSGEAPTTPRSPPGVREERELRVLGNGARYVGQWCGDQPDGEGTLTLPDGSLYRGQFVSGVAHGAGCFTTLSGDMYQGQWRSDQASGTGQYCGSDGRMYSGQWAGDMQHGRGTEVFANGTRYEGDFRKGLKHGVGKFSWKDGSVYEGQFDNNSIHGFGIHVWASGRRYEGQWVKEKMHGRGTYTFPSGCVYVGEYKDDLKAGSGTFTWTDGHVYTGQWEGGKQDGQGLMTSPDGTTRTGVWKAGRRVDLNRGGAQASPRTSSRQRAPSSPRDATPESVPWTPRGPGVEEPTPRPWQSSPGATSRMKSVLLGFVAAVSPFSARGQPSPSLRRACSLSRKPRKASSVRPPQAEDPEESISI